MPNEREPDINTTHVPDETQRRGEAFLRALPIMLIPLGVAIATLVFLRLVIGDANFPKDTPRPFGPLVPIVVVAVFFIALIALVRFGRPNLSSVIFIGVWTLLTTVFGLANGVSGVWAALLIVPICAAGLLLDGAASISLAALATVLIAGLGYLEWRGYVLPHDVPFPPFVQAYAPVMTAGFWIGIFWTIAALTYLFASNLQRALKQSRAQAKQLSEFSAQLEARVQQQTAKLVEQSSETAVMQERARVARDIHDTLAQGLTGIVVQLGAAQRAMDVVTQNVTTQNVTTQTAAAQNVTTQNVAAQTAAAQTAAFQNTSASDDLREHMRLAQDMARESLAEARRSIWNLRAPTLERGELRDALAGLAARTSNETTRVTAETHGEVWSLNADVESALLRVAQEALVNVGKHANATQVQVTLEYLPDAIRLLIHDNGIGWDETARNDENAVKGPTSGFGLMGMRERIAQWGGELKLSNEDGAKVEAMIPRTRAERAPVKQGVV